jgi:hypothetical protein
VENRQPGQPGDYYSLEFPAELIVVVHDVARVLCYLPEDEITIMYLAEVLRLPHEEVPDFYKPHLGKALIVSSGNHYVLLNVEPCVPPPQVRTGPEKYCIYLLVPLGGLICVCTDMGVLYCNHCVCVCVCVCVCRASSRHCDPWSNPTHNSSQIVPMWPAWDPCSRARHRASRLSTAGSHNCPPMWCCAGPSQRTASKLWPTRS